MKLNRVLGIGLAIVVVASLLRFWKLGSVPASPDWDEAAIGYNAYSLLKTGRDEFGTHLPMTFRSFNDYKPPLYIYLTVPSVAVFGLSLFSVRFPSAVSGVIAVIAVFFLVRELLEGESGWRKKSTGIALVSAGLLAVSPWHLQFSRVGFEANVALMWIIVGSWAFLRGMKKERWLLLVSAVAFVLSCYTYHTPRLFVPLLLLGFSWLYRDTFSSRIRMVVIAGVLGALLLLPIALDKGTFSRLGGMSTFRKQTEVLERSAQYLAEDKANGRMVGEFINNRRFEWTKAIISGYLSHFSLRWLFVTGDANRHHAPDMGLMYLMELPFLLVGAVVLWKRGGRPAAVLAGWLLLAPVAASLTFETPHAIRAYEMVPVLQILTAIGITAVWWKLADSGKKEGVRMAVFVVLSGLFFLNIAYYLTMYYVHMDAEYAKDWQFGYRQAVSYADSVRSKYDRIVVSESLEEPYIFFLFYEEYDPAKYLAKGGSSKRDFGPFVFRPFVGDMQYPGKTLYIGAPKEMPSTPVWRLYYPDGSEAFRATDYWKFE